MSLLRLLLNKRKYQPNQPMGTRKISYVSGGTFINPDVAMEVSAYYRGVIYISTQIAKLPWNIKDSDNKILENHRINKIIKLSPNPEMNSMSFRLLMIQQAIHYGNGYAEIERDNSGRPLALWPLESSQVQPVRDEEGKLIYRVIGGVTNNEDAYLIPKNIFHVKNFHTKDGLTGMSVVDFASEVLGIAKGADKFANSTFANGGKPAGILTTEGSLSDEAAKRVKESWEQNHGGRKVGGTALLENGLTYQSISHDFEQLQLAESKKMSVLDLARFLGLPPTKLFVLDAATFNNIENSNLEVAVDTLDAWARNLEMEADVKLLNNGFNGYKSEFDIMSMSRGDMETRGTYFNKLMQVGAITPNQIRKAEGQNSYEGGDRYYIATNNFTPADRVDEVVDSMVKKDETDDESDTNDVIKNYLEKRS